MTGCNDGGDGKEEQEVMTAIIKQTGRIIVRECDAFECRIMTFCGCEILFMIWAARLFRFIGIHHRFAVFTL
jgi:hypothetical protein